MKEELVNLHAGLCTLWVDHALLEPEIPRNSLVLIAPTTDLAEDGIYVLDKECPALFRCARHGGITISTNDPFSRDTLDLKVFQQFLVGKVMGVLTLWG